MGYFKAYDVRGIYGEDFGPEEVYKIGFFLPELLAADKVLVGYDARIHSKAIFDELARGITDSGSDVYTIGLATTPMVYYATAELGFDASVQITASHNPKEYNGLKVSKTRAEPVGYDSGLSILQKTIETENPVLHGKKGKIVSAEIREKYLGFLRGYTPDISSLTIGIDCSNGMAVILIKDLLGDQPEYLFDTLDGTFPNHDPNPLVEENVSDLKHLVLSKKCDIGIIFDGDADRVMFVDEKGRFVPPDLIIAVIAEFFLHNEKGPVVCDIRTSKSVTEYLKGLGAEPYLWKVGHAYAKPKMKELGARVGGELAGHYYYKDFYYCDSGILTALIVLQVVLSLQKEGRKFSELIDKIRIYENSGEINFRIENKSSAMETLKEHFLEREECLQLYDFDGYRLEFESWWFNVRPSNTEPYLRLLVEAVSTDVLSKKLGEIKEILSEFM
jgi:phosphomannomutase